MKVCEWCGKEITRTDKFKYCSQDCYQKATKHKQKEKRKLMPKKEQPILTMKKCKNCGKEFMQKVAHQEHCCYDCSLEYNCKKGKLRENIKRIAKKFDFELKNLDKIVNAKMRFFDDNERLRCPCDANNPKRYCGSARCIADTVYRGHCHCNMFHSKDKPVIEETL